MPTSSVSEASSARAIAEDARSQRRRARSASTRREFSTTVPVRATTSSGTVMSFSFAGADGGSPGRRQDEVRVLGPAILRPSGATDKTPAPPARVLPTRSYNARWGLPQAPRCASSSPSTFLGGRRNALVDSEFVLDLGEIDRSRVAEVGAKAANLGELSRIAGVDVPPGSCVTTHAFRRAVRGAPQLVALLDELTARDPDDRDGIAASSAELREAVGRVPVPDDVAARGRAQPRARHRLRRAVQCDGRGPPHGLLRRPAGQLPRRRGADGGPGARPAVLGLAVHRAGRGLPPAPRRRPPHRRDGRRHPGAGGPRRVGRAVHGRPGDLEPPGQPCGGGPRPRRGPGLRGGRRGPLVRARRRDRRRDGRRQAHRPAGRHRWRDVHAARRAGRAAAAVPDRHPGRAPGRPGPADRGAPRPPAGHRVVPGRRRVPDRAEPTDHHAVPGAPGRRRCRPRLGLGRSPADDDRRDDAPGAVRLADDHAPAHGRGRRPVVRRRHPDPGLGHRTGRVPGRHGPPRPAGPGRARDRDRPRRRRARTVRRRRRSGPRRRRAARRGAGACSTPTPPSSRSSSRTARRRWPPRHGTSAAGGGRTWSMPCSRTSRSCDGCCSTPAATRCSRRRWTPRSGSTSTCARGWGRSTRPTP